MSALDDILAERERQDLKWGVQNHPFHVWLAILEEEKGEACRAWCEWHWRDGSFAKVREEMVHTAAVAMAMVESLDRNGC